MVLIHINFSCKLWTCLRKNWLTTSLQWVGNPCTNSLTVCSSNPTTQENTSSKAKIVLWAYPQTLVVLKAFCSLSVSLYHDCYLGVMLWFWPQTLLCRCKCNFFFTLTKLLSSYFCIPFFPSNSDWYLEAIVLCLWPLLVILVVLRSVYDL